MTVDRSYTFQDGTTVELGKLSQLAFYNISSSEAGKPQPPVEPVTYAGGHKRKEPNFNNPDYIAKLAQWNSGRQARLMKFIINRGVKTFPPDDVAESYREYLDPSATSEETKYMWILEKLGDDEAEMNRFMEAVISQTMVTQEGLDRSEAAFPNDGGRQPDQDVPVQEFVDGEDLPVAGV